MSKSGGREGGRWAAMGSSTQYVVWILAYYKILFPPNSFQIFKVQS
jgi:hypothetical protein